MAQTFDPAAATAAYLAQLPPALHDKARAYTQGGHWLILWSALVAVAIAWLVLRSGVLAGVRQRVERQKPRPWAAVAAVVVVYGLIGFVLGLPWEAYAHWWRETAYGLTSQPFGAWLTEQGIALAVGVIQSLILLSLFYWLVRRAPRSWWLWASGGVVAAIMAMMVAAPILIEPLFNKYTPAPPGPVRDEIVAMATQAGVPHDKIFVYDGSKQSNRYTANVSGLFGTARVAMSDVMFKKDADVPEVRGVVGHEMGHYKRGHVLFFAVSYGALALIAFFLIDRLFPRIAPLLGAHGVQGVGDPTGLPVVAAIFAVLAMLMTPVTNSISRIGETDADRFSLEHFNEPDGLARALVKTIEYRYDSPSKLEEVVFYDHPAVRERIRRAMEWKAGHLEP